MVGRPFRLFMPSGRRRKYFVPFVFFLVKHSSYPSRAFCDYNSIMRPLPNSHVARRYDSSKLR